MKQLLLLALTICATSLVQAQVYVDATANGANDGSSWADAYTDLGTALADSTASEIWVAAGTYTPGMDSTATFMVATAVSIYGGFAGTESSLDDRDINANATIISGDNSGDDITDDFATNRTDNARHIVTVDSLLDGTVRIDGFTITGGNTTPGADGVSFRATAGGGIIAFNKVAIANCIFTQHSGDAGVALAIFGPPTNDSQIVTEGSSIDGCEFSDNFSDFGISYTTATDSLRISNTVYEDNVTDLGCIYISFSLWGDFNNIEISDNVGSFGAGIRYWQTLGMTLRNSEFSGNQAWYGAAIRGDMGSFEDQILPEGLGLTIDSCLFDGNDIEDPGNEFGYFGAAIFFRESNGLKISNSEFTGNTGNDLAGGIYINNTDIVTPDTTNFIIENVEFSGNTAEADGGSGGAAYTRAATGVFRNCVIEDNESDSFSGALYFVNSDILMRDCTIEDNTTNSGGGGGILVGFQGTTTLENCVVRNNTANFGGGISMQNDFTNLVISNSEISGNIAVTGSAGGILALAGTSLTISKSTLSQNTAAASVGGAINVSETNFNNADTLNMLTLNVDNSRFFLNTSTQGGAINIFNASGTMVNNELYNNTTTLNADGEGGGGGAISVNIFGDKPDEMTFINNTFGTNTAAGIGSNLSLFQDSIAQATINLQNNISYDISPLTLGIDIEGQTDNNLTINSLGGNLIAGDLALDVEAVFTVDAADVVLPAATAAEIFVSALLGDYHLAENSPAIDIGVSAGAPSEDIEGMPRPQGAAPDAGAYEKMIVGTREEVIDDATQLIVLPNPVHNTLYLQMNNEWTGDVSVRVMDLQGRQLRATQVRKFGHTQTFQIELTDLPAGAYEVLVSNGSALLARQIIKQ